LNAYMVQSTEHGSLKRHCHVKPTVEPVVLHTHHITGFVPWFSIRLFALPTQARSCACRCSCHPSYGVLFAPNFTAPHQNNDPPMHLPSNYLSQPLLLQARNDPNNYCSQPLLLQTREAPPCLIGPKPGGPGAANSQLVVPEPGGPGATNRQAVVPERGVTHRARPARL
jgi:hypothetical protein